VHQFCMLGVVNSLVSWDGAVHGYRLKSNSTWAKSWVPGHHNFRDGRGDTVMKWNCPKWIWI
jgi:hypothetical protein